MTRDSARPRAWPADVALVVVSYDSDDDLTRLLDTLVPSTAVVVDTGNHPASTERRVRDRARYVDAGDNIGFARAANLGAQQAGTPFFLFCNPDAEPTSRDVASLRGVLVDDPSVASVAPAVVGGTGSVRGGGGLQPTPMRALGLLLGPLWPKTRRIWLVPDQPRPYEVEWLSGACLLVRSDAFHAVGGFDERFPLYNEDMALGRRLQGAGWRQVLDGRVRVRHVSGGSALGAAERMWRWRGGSLGRYLLAETRPAPRVTWSLVLGAMALRALALRLSGSDGWREYAVLARALLRPQLPVLPRRSEANPQPQLTPKPRTPPGPRRWGRPAG